MPPARLLFYFATAGGIALAAHALIYEPPPLWIAVTALFLYINLISWGVVLSRFSMFADVVTAGPQDARGVALTFDDGPDPKSTPQVLELLDEANATATFFVIGHKAEAHPELIEEIGKRGHTLGLHSYAHSRIFSFYSPAKVRADLERAIDVLRRVTGVKPTLFRAPIGHVSPTMAKVARELDLSVIGWSARGVDGWSGAKAESVVRKIVPKLRDGAIVLLHDASERGDFIPASIDALPEILRVATERRLPFVRVDQWLGRGEIADAIEAPTSSS